MTQTYHKCSICTYEIENKTSLKRHIEIKPFKCKLCGYETAEKSILKRHIEAIHEGIKPFKCNICDYECAAKSTLKKHMMDSKHSSTSFVIKKQNTKMI